MAAAAKSTSYTIIGTSAGPESRVLVESTHIDVDSNIDFEVLVADAIELRIVSGTAATGSPSIIFTLQGYNPATKLYDDFVASAAVTAAGTTTLVVGTAIPNATNVSAARLVREKMRLSINYTGTPVTDVLNGVTVAVFAN